MAFTREAVRVRQAFIRFEEAWLALLQKHATRVTEWPASHRSSVYCNCDECSDLRASLPLEKA